MCVRVCVLSAIINSVQGSLAFSRFSIAAVDAYMDVNEMATLKERKRMPHKEKKIK